MVVRSSDRAFANIRNPSCVVVSSRDGATEALAGNATQRVLLDYPRGAEGAVQGKSW